MNKIIPDEAFIEKHYNRTIQLLEKNELTELKGLVESFAEEYATAPLNPRKDYASGHPGGLCFHNLHVLQWLGRFAGIMEADAFDKKSLLKVAILHDFGKVGLKGQPYFLSVQNDWQRDKGFYYETNPNLQFMKVCQRSLFLAHEASVPLTEDEHLAILLCNGQMDSTNSHYAHKEPKLAIALHYAVYWAKKLESENEVQWPKG